METGGVRALELGLMGEEGVRSRDQGARATNGTRTHLPDWKGLSLWEVYHAGAWRRILEDKRDMDRSGGGGLQTGPLEVVLGVLREDG